MVRRISRRLSTLTLVGATLAFSATAWPQVGGAASSEPGGDLHAWLTRIHEAAGRQNFQGTLVVSSGGSVASARIAHFCEGANQFERIESLGGKARNVFRHNDVVHTIWPA